VEVPPVYEPPVFEVPTVEAPVAEPLETEMPVVEVPLVEEPIAASLMADWSVIEGAVIEAPAVEAPAVESIESVVSETPTPEAADAEATVIETSVAERALRSDFGWDFSPPTPVTREVAPIVEVLAAAQPAVEALPIEVPIESEPVFVDLPVESPTLEVPVVEAPVFEVPVFEDAAVEVPVVEAFTVPEVVVEAPAVEAAPVTEPVEAPIAAVVDDLKARIEETRRRIRRELEQPFISTTPQAPADDWTIAPVVPSAPAKIEAEPAIDMARAVEVPPAAEELPVVDRGFAIDLEPPVAPQDPIDLGLAPTTAAPDTLEAAEPEFELGTEEPVDYESMRSRIELTRSRLKAKAFDAMMSGESSLLGRESKDAAPRPKYVPPVDSEVNDTIESSLREQEE
jgi:hypothetical protein